MYIDIDTEYGTINKAIFCELDGKIDDVHKLQYAGSVIYDRIMRDANEDFKRRAKDGLHRNTIYNVGEPFWTETEDRPQEINRV